MTYFMELMQLSSERGLNVKLIARLTYMLSNGKMDTPVHFAAAKMKLRAEPVSIGGVKIAGTMKVCFAILFSKECGCRF